MRSVSLGDIHRHIMSYKMELMGIAAILILLFHTDALPVIEVVQRRGEIGVDMFLLLGGYTCAMSYGKTGAFRFYTRRLRRVYLPFSLFLAISSLFAVFVFRDKTLSEAMGYAAYQMSLVFPMWFNELVMWYIPTVLALYLITPFFYCLCMRSRYWALLPFVMILLSCLLGVRDLGVPMFMLANRGPVYLIGVGLFVFYRSGVDIRVDKILVDVVGAVCLVLALTWSYSPFMDIAYLRYVYIPVLLMIVLNYGYVSATLRAVGLLSLELYLLQPFAKHLLYASGLSMHTHIAVAFELSLTFLLAYLFNTLCRLLRISHSPTKPA